MDRIVVCFLIYTQKLQACCLKLPIIYSYNMKAIATVIAIIIADSQDYTRDSVVDLGEGLGAVHYHLRKYKRMDVLHKYTKTQVNSLYFNT